MLGYPGTEQYRLRLGILLASSGMLLLLWSYGIWMMRSSPLAQAQAIVRAQGGEIVAPSTGGGADREARRDDRIQAARALPMLLFVVLTVVITLLVGGLVIVRAMRRHRIYLSHERPAPTEASDVWSMHRAPDDDDDLPDDDQSDGSTAGTGVQ